RRAQGRDAGRVLRCPPRGVRGAPRPRLPVKSSPMSDRPDTSSPPISFPETFNMASYFLDARLEEGRGERTAVIDDAGSHSYARVHDLAGRVAGALWRAGVRPEDRCLLALHDSVEFAAA